jgi:hypothetical protein
MGSYRLHLSPRSTPTTCAYPVRLHTESQIARGWATPYAPHLRPDPLTVGGRPVLEAARRHMNRDNLAFTRQKRYSLNRAKRMHGELHCPWSLGRSIQIDLRHLTARHVPGIFQLDRDGETSVCHRLHFQIGVRKRCIRKPIAKRKQRIDLLPIEPAISDINAFRKRRLLRAACANRAARSTHFLRPRRRGADLHGLGAACDRKFGVNELTKLRNASDSSSISLPWTRVANQHP